MDFGCTLNEGIIEDVEGFETNILRFLLFGKLALIVLEIESFPLVGGKSCSLLLNLGLTTIDEHLDKVKDLGVYFMEFLLISTDFVSWKMLNLGSSSRKKLILHIKHR